MNRKPGATAGRASDKLLLRTTQVHGDKKLPPSGGGKRGGGAYDKCSSALEIASLVRNMIAQKLNTLSFFRGWLFT